MPKKVARKPQNRKPTARQAMAVTNILENPGRPLSEVMREVGYSENTVRNPKDLTDSVAYRSIAEELPGNGFTPAATAQNITRISFTAKKQNQFTGEVMDDNLMQLNGMKFGAELMGWTNNDKDKPEVSFVTNIINFNGGDNNPTPVQA